MQAENNAHPDGNAADPANDVDSLRRMLLALLPALALNEPAQAQDAAKVQPDSYRVAFENDKLRVLDFVSRPGMGVCGVGLHSHPRHLTVAITAAKVRDTGSDGKSFIGELKPGDVFWTEAQTHTTENLSGREVRALLIEVKEPTSPKA